MTQSYCETCSADSYGAPLCSTCEALAEVERLRFELEQAQVGVLNANEQVNELRAEVERLREALRAIAEYQPREVVKDDFAYDRMVRGFQDAARAALAGKAEP